jgi:hypothetical protein
MILTALNTETFNSSFPNQHSSTALYPDRSITSACSSKISNASKLYLGLERLNLPGITNLFRAPFGFLENIKAIFKAEKVNDEEAVFENYLRLESNYLNFFRSLSQSVWYIFNAGIYFKIISDSFRNALIPLSISVSVFGFIICFIEGILETYELVRTTQFYYKQFPFEIEKIKKLTNFNESKKNLSEFLEVFQSQLSEETKNEIETFLRKKDFSSIESSELLTNLVDQIEKQIYLNKLQQLQKRYLQLSPGKLLKIENFIHNKFPNLLPAEQQKKIENRIEAELKTKKNDLIRRVHFWLADEIESNASTIIQDLCQEDSEKSRKAKEKAAEIFDHIKIQSHKKLLIHGVGLAAVLITLLGLILAYIACPFFILITILAIGGILVCARYYLHEGLMNSKGWEFKVKNCIPAWIKV